MVRVVRVARVMARARVLVKKTASSKHRVGITCTYAVPRA